jgi:hypothetical protein
MYDPLWLFHKEVIRFEIFQYKTAFSNKQSPFYRIESWFSFFFEAIDCPIPPKPPADGGTIIVRNSGLFYGHVCPGKSGFEPLPGQGCSANAIKIGPKTSTDSFKTSYDIVITVKATNPGRIVLLLDFSQPVDKSTVIISGSVGILNNNMTSKKVILILVTN